jgi:hypothetical protein
MGGKQPGREAGPPSSSAEVNSGSIPPLPRMRSGKTLRFFISQVNLPCDDNFVLTFIYCTHFICTH